MNKYRDKSDFEINKAVAVNINGTDAVVEKFGRIYISDGDRGAMVSFSPCNNPADAMPIIIENGISLINSDGVHFAAAPGCGIEGYLGGDTVGYGSRKYSENENIYRAAMEVFLMMKDAENEKN
ncbi:phage protein NinX family protein [Morganella morganii]|uniref:phage protein NinX family protein n=1 Tax=Morganella morganii TaxID=582 RepID=UPI003EB87B98